MAAIRTIRHADGRRELIRVLSQEDLTGWKQDDPLSYERSIVWLGNIDQLPYVRVVEVRCAKSRRGRLRLQGSERLVGYSKLMADAPRDLRTGKFTRRLFYLKAGDHVGRAATQGRVVDPRTVLPGVPGEPPVVVRR